MRSSNNFIYAMNGKHIRVGFFRGFVNGFQVNFLKSNEEVKISSGCVFACLEDIPMRYRPEVSRVIGQIIASVPEDEMPPAFIDLYAEILSCRGITNRRSYKPCDYENLCREPIRAQLETEAHDYNISISLPETSATDGRTDSMNFGLVEYNCLFYSNKELAEIQKQCKADLVNHPDAIVIYYELCETLKKRGVPLA